MSPILDVKRGRFYRKGDVFTTGKSGIDSKKFAHKLNRALQFHIDEMKNPSPK